jgi:hypothetical protein
MERIGARRAGVAVVITGLLVGAVACSGADSASTASSTSVAPTTLSVPTSSIDPSSADVIISFPDAASVAAWRNVDDSVMGGVSASTSSWLLNGGRGAMEFTGELSTDNNGGFASTLSRVDKDLGTRASGSRALGVRAIGDGRTYLLQLRAGPSGAERWISRFTPPTVVTDGIGPTVDVSLESFEPVNQFLRPIDPVAALDPATISQIGVYVLDGQVGSFRLVLESVSAVR